jgi:hypothetical protein
MKMIIDWKIDELITTEKEGGMEPPGHLSDRGRSRGHGSDSALQL